MIKAVGYGNVNKQLDFPALDSLSYYNASWSPNVVKTDSITYHCRR